MKGNHEAHHEAADAEEAGAQSPSAARSSPGNDGVGAGRSSGSAVDACHGSKSVLSLGFIEWNESLNTASVG